MTIHLNSTALSPVTRLSTADLRLSTMIFLGTAESQNSQRRSDGRQGSAPWSAYYRRRDGEFKVHHAAVAKHHDKETEPSAAGTDVDEAKGAPVDPGALTRSEGELQERLLSLWPHLAHIVLDDGIAPVEALLADPLEHLGRTVGMGFKHPHN
jgi:hypothetical protein